MLNTSIKIAYVMGAPFPTKKAYGVTSRETINVLLKNEFKIKVFCLAGNYNDSDFNNILKVISVFKKSFISKILINFGSLGTSKLNFFSWRMGIIKVVTKNLKSVRDFSPELIWVRDPMIAFLYLKNFSSIKIILEVHDQTGIFYHKKLIKYNDRINYFPINWANKDFLHQLNPMAKSKIAPMGINYEILATRNDCLKFANSLKHRGYMGLRIGYVGKMAPSGYSKGVEDLIEFAKYAQSKKLSLNVTLVGATDTELFDLTSKRNELLIKKKYLDIKGHVKHSRALQIMRTFDILILPAYLSNDYNGMPLKLLEYLSTGKITLVADTPLYRNIFTTNFIPFFYKPKDMLSLENSIYSAIKISRLNNVLESGVNFASKFTWTNRTLDMLSITAT